MAEPRSPKQQLSTLGLHPKRHFGQNFLADRGLAERIARLAAPAGGTVVELGAGLGALTAPLLEHAEHVIAVERDRDLVPVLRADFAGEIAAGRLSVLEADAKGIDFPALCAGRPRPHVLAGNLPYQITGPLLTLAMHIASSLERVVFLVQLEVADRLAARAGDDNYGALSVFAQAAFQVSREMVIRKGAFYPQPGVDSAVVQLTPRPDAIRETEAFAALVHAAFGQRRKKLSNAWHGVLGLDSEGLALAAARAAVDLTLRGERLTVEDFERMARAAGELEA